jgi:peptide deformylase
MTIRKILTYPDKFLRQPTKPVLNIDGAVQEIIDDMADTMYEAPGIGLAAIQVGCDKSILIYDGLPGEVKRSLQVLINPKIVDSHGEILSENEGCLSVPEFSADVKRSNAILIEGLDRDGKQTQIEADGFLAIVLQHEIDHLNGRLFIDHISALKRELYKRRIKKKLRNK